MSGAAFHWVDPRGAKQRLIYAVLAGFVAWLLAPERYAWLTRTLIGGVTGGSVLLAFAMWIIVRSDEKETRRRAAAQDAGRTLVWLIVLVVCGLSLFAATFVMREAKSYPRGERELALALTIAGAALSWCLTHAAFTLRYAHLYYREGRAKEGGIEFPKDEDDPDDACAPDDLDFMYFAFTLGMCFQVSDAQITSRLIRRTALAHAMLSFAFNTGIIALVLNVVVNQLG